MRPRVQGQAHRRQLQKALTSTWYSVSRRSSARLCSRWPRLTLRTRHAKSCSISPSLCTTPGRSAIEPSSSSAIREAARWRFRLAPVSASSMPMRLPSRCSSRRVASRKSDSASSIDESTASRVAAAAKIATLVPATLRPASASDAAAISELTSQLGYVIDAATLSARLERILARPDHLFLIAEMDGRPVGWVHGEVSEYVETDGFVRIGGLVVDRSHRKQGIGALLM